jgi:hypothetical protein
LASSKQNIVYNILCYEPVLFWEFHLSFLLHIF